MARNGYRKHCYVCGLMVEVGTGHYERYQRAWRVKHAIHPGDGRVTCEMAKRQAATAIKAAESCDIAVATKEVPRD